MRPVTPAAIFEGDIVVTGTVHSLQESMPPPAPAKGDKPAVALPVPERGVYRDVHSGKKGTCGPWFVGMRNKGLYVSNKNISLAEFEKLRGVCCVYPRRPQCPGWVGIVSADGDGADEKDIPELRRRQTEIYDAVSLEEARQHMDRSSYFVAPSRTFQLSGMPISTWNMTSGAAWLQHATLAIPSATVHPGHSADDLLRAELSTPTQKISTGITPLKRGILPDTGTFLLDGDVFGFMPLRAAFTSYPTKTTSATEGNCSETVSQGLRCAESPKRAKRCAEELHSKSRGCCGTLADNNIMIHCI